MSAGIILLGLGASVVVGTLFARPIQRLPTSPRASSGRRPDTDHRHRVEDEVGQLAETFRQMVEKLRRSR